MEDYRLEQTGQEVQRILNGAAMEANLQAEVERATDAEGTLQENIDAEAQARQDADSLLQQAIDDEEQRAKDAEEANAGEIEDIKALIPSTASDANKLADTNYVNSSIQTATAEYRGDYNVVTDLHLAIDATHAQIETLLPTVIAEADKNDYCYVMIPTNASTPTEIAKIERYKMTSEGWKFEYDVNNSTFTAEEWAAIKSGITSGLVAKLNALPTNADLLLLLAGKQDVLTFDSVPVPESNNPVKSGGVYSAIDDEKTARLNSDTAIHAELDGLQAKVPATASSDNKLVDQNQMNSSISTATATFRGDWNVVSDLHLAVDATRAQIAALLPTVISTADNNDYCYVEIPTSAETPTQIERVERYKFNGTAWAYEYTLNNSGFTADQWAAINSMITSGLVAKLSALPTNADLLAMLAQKQDNLTFDSTPTENSTNPVTSGGVFAADKALSDAIEAILLLIPSAASSLNKLVDTSLMNSSISTATATFRGTYNLVSDLGLGIDATEGQIAAALLSTISTSDNNDYAFVQIPTSAQTPTQIARTDRYKFNGTAWSYEYTLNTSGFTAQQWAAINSTITSAMVAKLNALPTAAELQEALGTLTSGITAINQKVPSTASQSNKLVDNASMESYIAQVINILDASFNVTSTDGHITLHITQVDGVITSVQVQSTDIASAAALTLVTNRVTTAEGNIANNTSDIANLQQLYNNLQQSKPLPVTALPTSGQQQGVIYRLAGTTSYSDYMWNGSSWVLMATYNNAVDDFPTFNSENLAQSGGIYEMGIDIVSKTVQYVRQDQNGYLPKCRIISGRFYVNPDNPNLYYRLGYYAVSKGDIVQVYSSSVNNGNDRGILFFESVPADGAAYTALYLGTTNNYNEIIIINKDGYIGCYGNGGYYLDKAVNVGSVIDDKIKDALININPNFVAENTPILFNNPIPWQSLSEGVSKDGNTYTFTASATAVSYIGVAVNSIRPANNKWLKIFIFYKAGGDYEHLVSSVMQLYAAENNIRNSNIEKNGVYITYTCEVNFTSLSQNLYANMYMSSAVGSATLELIGAGYAWIEDSDLDLAAKRGLLPTLINSIVEQKTNIIYVDLYCYPQSGTDTATTFYGLQSISNAINSITDASYYKRYRINIIGEFHFTSPSQLTMIDVDNVEYSVIYAKPYVSYKGTGIDRSVIFVDLPSSVGSAYSNYQPIYVDCGGEVEISDMKIIGKNCRYTIHFEFRGTGAVRSVKNCHVIHLGLDGISSQGFQHAFGTGMGAEQTWNIENCYIESFAQDFAVHTMLANYNKQGLVNITNCTFGGQGLSVHGYPNISDMNVNLKSCSFGRFASVTVSTYAKDNNNPDMASQYLSGKVIASGCDFKYNANGGNGLVLRIDSLNKSNAVSFNVSSSAFDAIVGDSAKTGIYFTDEAVYTQYGYFFRKGVAYGSKDIQCNSMATRLGDCTGTNKVLKITVGSVEYTITFNEDYSEKTNDYVIQKINNVIGSVATASIFSSNLEYYPQVDNLCTVLNTDTGEITSGMGVVFTSTGMRRALNSDGYIDGVCLDTIQPDEKARVLLKGKLSTYNTGGRFSVIESDNTQKSVGTQLGISSTLPGVFDAAALPKIIKIVNDNIVQW